MIKLPAVRLLNVISAGLYDPAVPTGYKYSLPAAPIALCSFPMIVPEVRTIAPVAEFDTINVLTPQFILPEDIFNIPATDTFEENDFDPVPEIFRFL